MRHSCFFTVLLYAVSAFASHRFLSADELQPLAYRSEGLIVDLGVGLWAWPVPCDADNDGDYDLIVSCPDKPSNGVWYFENAGATQNGLPVFRPSKRLSSTVHYVMPSYVDGQLRILSPGFEYSSFATKGLSEKVTLPIPALTDKDRAEKTVAPKDKPVALLPDKPKDEPKPEAAKPDAGVEAKVDPKGTKPRKQPRPAEKARPSPDSTTARRPLVAASRRPVWMRASNIG